MRAFIPITLLAVLCVAFICAPAAPIRHRVVGQPVKLSSHELAEIVGDQPLAETFFIHFDSELKKSVEDQVRYFRAAAEEWSRKYMEASRTEPDQMKAFALTDQSFDQQMFMLERDKFLWALDNDLVLVVDARAPRPAVPVSVATQGASIRLGKKTTIKDHATRTSVESDVYFVCIDSMWDAREQQIKDQRLAVSQSAILHWISEFNGKLLQERQRLYESRQIIIGEIDYDPQTFTAITPAWAR